MTDHVCTIEVSRDGGHTWRALTIHDIGDVGKFERRVLRTRMSQSRQFVFRVTVSSPYKRDLIAAAIQTEAGDG